MPNKTPRKCDFCEADAVCILRHPERLNPDVTSCSGCCNHQHNAIRGHCVPIDQVPEIQLIPPAYRSGEIPIPFAKPQCYRNYSWPGCRFGIYTYEIRDDQTKGDLTSRLDGATIPDAGNSWCLQIELPMKSRIKLRPEEVDILIGDLQWWRERQVKHTPHPDPAIVQFELAIAHLEESDRMMLRRRDDASHKQKCEHEALKRSLKDAKKVLFELKKQFL